LNSVLRRDLNDVNLSEGIFAQFEQARVLVEFGAIGDRWGSRGDADAIEFLLGKDVEGDGIETEKEFVGGGGILEEGALAAFVLPDQSIDDVEGYIFGEVGFAEDFGNGAGEEARIGFEAEEIIRYGTGDAVEDSTDAGLIVVEQRGDEDVAGNVAGDQPAEVGFAASDFVGGAGGGSAGEFEISENELTQDGVFVGICGVKAGVGGAGESDAEGGGDVLEAGRAQVDKASVPEDDAICGVSGVEETADDGGSDDRTGAGGGTGGGMDFDANDVLGLDEAAPGFSGVCFAGEGDDTAGDHGGDDVGLGGQSAGGGRVADDKHPGIRDVRGTEQAWIGEAKVGRRQTKRLTKQKEREYDSRHDVTIGRGALERLATRTLAGARMLTTSKPHWGWCRPVAATGLILLLVGCTPPGPRALLEGERLIREGRSEDAIRRLRTAVEFLPGNAQAWNHLGLAYHGAKRPTEASEAYQQALRLDRNLSVAYFNSGCLYLEHGEPTLATDALWAYVGLQPRVVEGWVKLGQSQLRMRKWDQAERSFAEALRLNPARVDALNGLGVAYQQRRKVREAWQSFTNAVMREPGFAPAWMNLGVIAQQTGANAKAVQAYRQYASLRPEMARQMDLASVIRKLETPPAFPVIQLPPAPQNPTPASDARGSTNSPAAGAAPPSGAAVEAPAHPPEALRPESIASTETITNGTAHARPPPVFPVPEAAPALAEVSPSPAVTVPGIEVPGSDASVTQEVAVVSLPQTPHSEPPSVDPTPVAATSANSVAAALETESPDSLVLHTPPPAVASAPAAAASTGAVEYVLPIPVIPVDRVDLPRSDSLVMGVRDEAPPAEASSSVSAGADAAETGLAPLVRPVGAQRWTSGSERDDKRGFWSRANPVTWFGSDDSQPKPESADDPSNAGADRETSGGTWRWANPASWFRGTSENGSATAASENRLERTDGGSTWTNAPSAAVGVAVVPTDVRERGAAGGVEMAQVRRAQVPTWTLRPVSTLPEPVRPRDVEREIRRYAYLRPAKPAEGNRTAAKGVLAQAQEEHRRDRASAAIRLYEEALQLDPSLAEGYQELALAAMQLDDLPRALSAGEMGLLLQPQAVVARLNFALALDRGGFPIDAAVEAERVVAAKADHVAAHLLLGNLNAQKLGRPDLARAHYLRVIELEPTHPQSVAIRRWLAGRP